MKQGQHIAYAPFGRRLIAWLIDLLILAVLFGSVIYAVNTVLGLPIEYAPTFETGHPVKMTPYVEANFWKLAALWFVIKLIVAYSYMTCLESSRWQATPGKLALGIMVTGLNGDRISVGRATVRFFGRLLSGCVMCLGYVMAAFTEKRQALHDILAGTLVLRRAGFQT